MPVLLLFRYFFRLNRAIQKTVCGDLLKSCVSHKAASQLSVPDYNGTLCARHLGNVLSPPSVNDVQTSHVVSSCRPSYRSLSTPSIRRLLTKFSETVRPITKMPKL